MSSQYTSDEEVAIPITLAEQVLEILESVNDVAITDELPWLRVSSEEASERLEEIVSNL